jgi:phage terminase small subunit
MPNPRTKIDDLKLQGGNLKRALSYPPKPESLSAEARAEMERMFCELKDRRGELLADIRENGLLVFQEKWSNGKNIAVRVANPAIKLLQTTERQLVQLAKLIGPAGSDPKGKTDFERELDAAFKEFGHA